MPAVQMRDRCSAADCYGSVGHEIRGLTRTSAGHDGITESCATLRKTLKVVKSWSCGILHIRGHGAHHPAEELLLLEFVTF